MTGSCRIRKLMYNLRFEAFVHSDKMPAEVKYSRIHDPESTQNRCARDYWRYGVSSHLMCAFPRCSPGISQTTKKIHGTFVIPKVDTVPSGFSPTSISVRYPGANIWPVRLTRFYNKFVAFFNKKCIINFFLKGN